MKILSLFTILTLLLIPNITLAANHYILDGGSGDGSDWANAWDTLPSTLTRGDTYYIADGTYTFPWLNDAVSGTAVIYIKKAIESDHGTDTGWSSTYGDGQAIHSGAIHIATPYWEINGQTRTGWDSGHGFKINYSGSAGITLEATDLNNLTLKYIETDGGTMDSGTCGFAMMLTRARAINSVVSYNYMHDNYGAILGTGASDNILVEYNMFARNGSDASCHAQAIADTNSDNVTIRYNIFADIEGTGIITALNRDNTPRTVSGWKVYGNLFYRSDGNPYNRGDVDWGIVQSINSQSAVGWEVYNNTIVNLLEGAKGRSGVSFSSVAYAGYTPAHSNITVYNNLWYDSEDVDSVPDGGLNPGTECTNCLSAYNYFMKTSHIAEANEENYPTKDPSIFVNYSGENFRLTSSTSTGFSLTSPFNVDVDTNTRGGDGTWDRGAYEYGSGLADIIAPSPPTNLVVSNQ